MFGVSFFSFFLNGDFIDRLSSCCCYQKTFFKDKKHVKKLQAKEGDIGMLINETKGGINHQKHSQTPNRETAVGCMHSKNGQGGKVFSFHPCSLNYTFRQGHSSTW